MKNYDFLIVGGGIFGISTAIELKKRGYSVGLINPDTIPNHLAASTDVSKVVRMEYGSDALYLKMVEYSMGRWTEWNEQLQEKLYHECGYLMLCKEAIGHPAQIYERDSLEQMNKAGYQPEILDAAAISERFPAVNHRLYKYALFNPKGGYVQSGRVVERLADYARSIGVAIHEGQTGEKVIVENGRLTGVETREGGAFSCGHAIIAAGTGTAYILPELQPYFKATGHPVFWLRPADPALFSPPQFGVFTADISNTGWYGFPYLSEHGIVKVAKHSNGLVMHPEKDDRRVWDQEVAEMRDFLKESFPALAEAPLVFTRRCLYTDTLDGHFWIDRHPEIKGLSVCTGGSGHGLKMGPIIGEITADMAEGKENPYLDRFKWRHLTKETLQVEEARFVVGRKL